MIKDQINTAQLIEKHCDNLRDFKQEKLEAMGKSTETENRNRRRRSITDLYSSDVEEIAELVLQTIKDYIEVDEMAKKTAQEKALADYMFWYNNNEEKRRDLERIVYNH